MTLPFVGGVLSRIDGSCPDVQRSARLSLRARRADLPSPAIATGPGRGSDYWVAAVRDLRLFERAKVLLLHATSGLGGKAHGNDGLASRPWSAAFFCVALACD